MVGHGMSVELKGQLVGIVLSILWVSEMELKSWVLAKVLFIPRAVLPAPKVGSCQMSKRFPGGGEDLQSRKIKEPESLMVTRKGQAS